MHGGCRRQQNLTIFRKHDINRRREAFPKRKYQELGHKTKKLDKEIVFYCNGKPITDENEQIGKIAEGPDFNFEILSVSLNDSSVKDDFKIQEKLIDKLAGKRQYHSEIKELLIFVDCGKAICEKCSDKHQGLKKIYKKELINSGKELKQKSNVIYNTLIECGFRTREDVIIYAWKKSRE